MDARRTAPTETKSDSERVLDRLSRYQAARDHSRFELEQKLLKLFPPELVTPALDEAARRRWLSSDEEVAARAVLQYERQLKSPAYIQAQLAKRRLPVPPTPDTESESAKIRAVAGKKFGNLEDLNPEQRAKALRFLINRGFDEYRSRQVLNYEEQ